MIQASDIKKALDQRPFLPFELHLDNGRVVSVKQTDALLFNESRTMTLIVEHDNFHIIPLMHITELVVLGEPTSEQLMG